MRQAGQVGTSLLLSFRIAIYTPNPLALLPHNSPALREYTDASFTVRKAGPNYTGLVGPLLIAEVRGRLCMWGPRSTSDPPGLAATPWLRARKPSLACLPGLCRAPSHLHTRTPTKRTFLQALAACPLPTCHWGFQVGDRLDVHFRNALVDLPHYPVNIAPGGGLVEDGSDAACAGGAPVAAGEDCVYRWIVPDTAGPAIGEPRARPFAATKRLPMHGAQFTLA
mgnify:CR=1 FL=1